MATGNGNDVIILLPAAIFNMQMRPKVTVFSEKSRYKVGVRKKVESKSKSKSYSVYKTKSKSENTSRQQYEC